MGLCSDVFRVVDGRIARKKSSVSREGFRVRGGLFDFVCNAR